MPVIFGSIPGLAGTAEQNELPKPSINENSAGGLKNQKKVGSAGHISRRAWFSLRS